MASNAPTRGERWRPPTSGRCRRLTSSWRCFETCYCQVPAPRFLYNHLTPMATASPPAQPVSAQRVPLGVRLHRFWQRVTEGLELTQLWSQFETEARTSYRLYSRDVAAKTPEGLTRRGHRLHVVREFFWAVLEKLSPARRVLLLEALI